MDRDRSLEPGAGIRRSNRISVRLVRRPDEVEAARVLFREYRAWLVNHWRETQSDDRILQIGLGYLDSEIETLPGAYVPPRGALALATKRGAPAGCGALRPVDDTTGEVKRIFVRPAARGVGVGHRIARALLRRAKALGYARVVLDTLPTMTNAAELYRKVGFIPIASYWDHPVAGALFFEYRLQDGTDGSRRELGPNGPRPIPLHGARVSPP